ncbi:anti-sigma factor family protein [Streptomyces sp. PsTaAH-124]|uniref:anti-sigma factor family protein n=1 Tax=Streptomyces sp. PsTaAH-124 TaxID=1157638 RepID=UPI000475869A|nr:zf-HC2 domain-containing protein [Streptomyces sp. PsTaAH-124]
MSGSRSNPAARGLAEQHLGDRLSALVDGELGHETRERVLAHVATCPKCKAEVDAQRRLKNVFAESAPPPPSESFLARLQGLPGGDPGSGSPLGGAGFPGGFPAFPAGSGDTGGTGGTGDPGMFGARRGEQFAFGYGPAGPYPVEPVPERSEGFRIHHVNRPDNERSASRGRRFAFVAAGAVSLAAVALGGVTTGAAGDTAAETRGGAGAGSNVTPARSAGTGIATASEASRRRNTAGALPVQRSTGTAPPAPTSLSAPLLPGVPTPAAAPAADAAARPLPPTPVVAAGAALMSPLIRPLGTRPLISLTWSADPQLTTAGLLTAPSPGPTPEPPSAATSHLAP